jgi:hypothetical protein
MNEAAKVDPQSDFKVFRGLVHEELRSVISEFSLQETEAHLLYPGMWTSLRNRTTQVTVHFEYASSLWLTIGRLAEFQGRTVGGEQYNLNYLLQLRAPDRVNNVMLDHFDADIVKAALQDCAAALILYADDVLKGDFATFPTLREIVDARMAQRDSDEDGSPGLSR